MDYKVAIKELLNEFNIPLTLDYRRKRVFELVETTGLITSSGINDLNFIIKSEVLFHTDKSKTHNVLVKKAELPINNTTNFLEQLLKFQEEFYKSLYTDLVRFMLFAKEAVLQDHNGEPYKVIPINKLILGEGE